MPPIDEPVSFDPKASTVEARRPKAASGKAEQLADGDFLAFTVEPTARRIVKVERVDAAGGRHEVSADDAARWVKGDARPSLEQLVEQAFEAGINCVLGDESDMDERESKEDAELSRALLRSLIERSAARQLLRREILGPAFVGALVEQAAAARPGTSEGAPAAH